MNVVRRLARLAGSTLVLCAVAACSDAASSGTGGSTSTNTDPTTTITTSAMTTGSGGAIGTGGMGGTGGGTTTTSTSSSTTTTAIPSLDAVLAALRADRDGTLKAHANEEGWPLETNQGFLFVSTSPTLKKLAGEHNQWMPEAMMPDQGFVWLAVASIPDDDHYKFTDGTTYAADPWSRSVNYDNFGEISIARAKASRLDRFFGLGDANVVPRTVRVWVPDGAVSHELYVHDGQNLFDPEAAWGGWHLQDTAPNGMLIVGIDNTPDRMDEYTHVPDVIQGSSMIGGKGDEYADFLQLTVRPLVRKHYGEPGPVGVMGSSLGGLISLEIAYRYPGDYAFAASLSGTMGWGSIGNGIHNQTMIERYAAKGHQMPVLYVDAGGGDGGSPCLDSDGDGIDDDSQNAGDNYCENAQLDSELLQIGYKQGTGSGDDLFFHHEPGAEHNEAAWAARVFRPLGIFAAL